MELSELQNRMAELKRQIEMLPAGSITKKTINGNGIPSCWAILRQSIGQPESRRYS